MTSVGSVEGAVLVTIDSLRADALGPTVTPTLHRLASRATTFDRCYAHGNWTPFAFPSLLGARPVFADGADIGLGAGPTLAETLSGSGVRTAGFNAANGFLTEYWGYDRGFDRFESFIDGDAGPGSRYLAAHPTVNGWVQLASSPAKRAANLLRGGEPKPFVDVSHLWDVERRARDFLEAVEGPFFLWVHYMDAHTPYVPAPRHLRAVGARGTNLLTRLRAHLRTGLGWRVDERTLDALRSLYLGAVHQVDASLARLLGTLEAVGHRDSTAVVVTGDHGEEFQDHGHLAHYPKLHEELLRVPLFVDLPGADPRRVPEPVGHDGVPSTVTAAMGIDPAPFDGASLLPTVRKGADPNRGPVTSLTVRGERITQQPIPRRPDEGTVLVSARDRRYTYIEHDDGRRELYDRRTDPTEQRDRLSAEGADAVAIPERVLARLRDAARRRRGRLPVPAEEESEAGDAGEGPTPVTRRLEALGYR